MTEILILDFNRPEELKTLLESIQANAKFEKDVIVLNNGGERYADQYKEEGLCAIGVSGAALEQFIFSLNVKPSMLFMFR